MTFATAASADEGLPAGTEAPAFSLKTLGPSPKMVALKDLVGKSAKEPKKAVLLSFGASYCEPCKKEMAELVHLVPGWEKEGVFTAVVLIDTEADDIAKMEKYLLEELKAPFPVLADRFNILARRYKAELLPYAVLIDASGTVRWSHTGYDKKALTEAIASVLKGS